MSTGSINDMPHAENLDAQTRKPCLKKYQTQRDILWGNNLSFRFQRFLFLFFCLKGLFHRFHIAGRWEQSTYTTRILFPHGSAWVSLVKRFRLLGLKPPPIGTLSCIEVVKKNQCDKCVPRKQVFDQHTRRQWVRERRRRNSRERIGEWENLRLV